MANSRSDVLAHVARNLRELRTQRGLSQAALARASGISRRMIVNVEGGDTNISLASLDRLAEALDVTFVDMVRDPDHRSRDPDIRDLDVVAWRGADTHSVGILRASVPARQEVQLWTWALGPGERYDAEPDPPGWQETVLVVDGRLVIAFADAAVDDRELVAGEHITFPSSQHYSYINHHDEPTRFVRNLVY
ncbi:MAG: helix-turn-helix domain-containing protein [Gordonia sp. (in: high G+C Gram-positive bacteria)]